MTPRQRNAMVRKIVEHLRPMVAGVADFHSVAPRAGIELPPLLTTEVFEGVPLADLMVPGATASDDAIEERFAYTLFKLIKPEMSDEEPEAKLPAQVQKFVGRSPERFLVWAGRQPGWSLETTPDLRTFVAANGTSEIGVRDGVLLCRYKEYLEGAGWTPSVTGITEPQGYMSKDKAVTLMWGRLRPDSYERSLLGAARFAYQNKFSSIAPWLFATRRIPTAKIERALVSRSWPIKHLFDLLVPHTLDRRTFYRTFGCPKRWTENPAEYVRERAYLKLDYLGVVE